MVAFYSAAFSLDGIGVLSAGSKETAQLWETERGEKLSQFERHDYRINSVAFSCDGKRVLTGSGDCTVRIWETY